LIISFKGPAVQGVWTAWLLDP